MSKEKQQLAALKLAHRHKSEYLYLELSYMILSQDLHGEKLKDHMDKLLAPTPGRI